MIEKYLNKVWNCDCLELMKKLPDKSVDMVLCDLPYGTTACKWDNVIPFEPLWECYERIIKDNGAIVLTASQPFTSLLVCSNLKMFKCEWIWHKNRGSNFATTKYMPMKEHESILIFGKNRVNYYPIKEVRSQSGLARSKYKINPSKPSEVYNNLNTKNVRFIKNLRCPSSVKNFNCETGLHPTQKPVALFEYLIKTYSNKDDIVLDNCLGSGTTAVACERLGRQWIGVEKEPKYVAIANERIKAEQAQLKLPI